ncbi:hypothetical protein PIROE2DRAFT_3243 [Piromyces sp. E2]|nr:hypothetical protein PIROE2DRAFT_3243 [Piromyces sp. E2]|eukprot:OUM69004.1 hypothetical protein PIROE2DRAFT_3243 [Piromyces sp. E2]
MIPLLIAHFIINESWEAVDDVRGFKKSCLTYMKKNIFEAVLIGLMVIIILMLIFGGIAGMNLFKAKKYASIISIKTVNFTDIIHQTDTISDIALMDTETAKMFGERTLGELEDLVSAYDVADQYTTINLNGKPMKISPLEYDSFFKYKEHQDSGIPGYVLVDPVNNVARYVKSQKSINYSPSAYYGKYLKRKLWSYNPTAIYGDSFFELDENDGMYWITPILKASIGLFNGKIVKSVVITDATTGECKTYELSEIPSWVDIVIDGDTIRKYYNWYGKLRNGFWNSIFAQNGCFVTTDDYGYKTINDDVYIYTGVTSCNNSKSVTGFVLANSRTGEILFMPVTGAEEHSAMSTAEGEVADYGWKASFPSIININGEPAYLMVLKDSNNIVKRYAIVNISNYSIVAIDTTQKKVLQRYNALLMGENDFSGNNDSSHNSQEVIEIPENAITKTITIKEIQYIVNGTNTIVYVKDTEGKVYKSAFDETWILKSIGDQASITFVEASPISRIK